VTTNKTITSLLYNLWRHVSNRRRRQFGLLLILMLLASFAEVFSIGAVLPFLGVLTAPERVFEYAAAKPVIHLLGISTPAELLLPLTITFCLAALLAGLMRLILLWASTRLSFATGADLSISIYRRTLYQPYAVHCARNSSEVISGISVKTSNAISAISQALNVISSVVMMTIILIALLSVNVVIALTAFGGFGLIYILIIGVTRKKLLIDSQRIARESSSVIKALQEGLGGIRDVLIDGNQDVYCQIYRNADIPLRRAQGNNFFIAASPRYGMEALGMVLISFIAYSLALKTDGISSAIPILGALALGALRLLPVLQQAYGAWTSIQGGQVSLQDTIELLDQPLPDYADYPVAAPLTFKNNINLNQLGFNYDYQNPYVLKQVNLSIAKGSRIGFIGATGSGKSTLLDIIMGLLQPTEGALEVDGEVITTKNRRAWQAHIAHVPQTIFLADTSVEQNIAFGVPKDQIDFNRVVQAAKQAQISNTIENWPKKYETFVGERGVRLSGGQRQRIGIARALYKQADVIIFDEATSALDDETEQAVMQSIDSLSKELTLLIIAHRLTTLKNCTQIVELDGGIIKRAGTYQDIMNQKARSLL
jgi:ABC-type multidrug transport system fused ATPase/permease subunit